MIVSDIQLESLILVAVGKLYSEQSAYMIKEYKQRTRFDFNVSVKSVDTFIAGIENNMEPHEKEFLQELTDCLINGLTDMKKGFKEKDGK